MPKDKAKKTNPTKEAAANHPSSASSPSYPGFIPPHGGYEKLLAYRKSQIIYDATVRFCDRFIDKRSRTHDQMVQAARSGNKNVAEGSQISGTSRESELKLTNVARASLEELLGDYCDYLESVAPVRLEVLDRATHEALERLIAAGLIAPVSRAARPLHPVAETLSPLSAEELARVKAQRDLAGRKLKMARLLTDGGMADEARSPLLDAARAVSLALAVENRLPEPGALEDTLLPPLAAPWGVAVTILQNFASQPTSDGAALIQVLDDLLETLPTDVDCPF